MTKKKKKFGALEAVGVAMTDCNTWIMIPARGGSRGLPRKNVRLLAGVPLIVHVIRSVLESRPAGHVVVITDDDEIEAVASSEGVVVIREPQTTGNATLDDVAMKVVSVLLERGASKNDIFLTVQPTCPFINGARVDEAIALFDEGAGSVISVVDDRHLGWRQDAHGRPVPDYKVRVNRQRLPPQFRETGAIIGCRIGSLLENKTRIVEPIRLVEIGKKEALDIDDFSDWAVAEHFASRRSIIIRADANEKLGMGHVFRALAIAQELAHHQLTLATDSASQIGVDFLSQFPFDFTKVDGDKGFIELVGRTKPDLVILDQLDTEGDYVRKIKRSAGKVVTFEDLGSGALEADLVVSDLYENLKVPAERQLTTVANAILAPNFETVRQPAPFNQEVGNILLVFGGTDPSRLTEKALKALSCTNYRGKCSVIIGPGFKRAISLEAYGLTGELHSSVRYMPGVMQKADLAISSAGRTVTELASLGVPVLCLCQNAKELTHTHASAQYGVITLGLGELVDVGTISAHIERLIENTQLRQVLRERALHETAERKNAKVIKRILRAIGWER